MTRTYALKRLLQLGPMTRSEIVEAMGGNEHAALRALERLCERKEIFRMRYRGCSRFHYFCPAGRA